MIRTHKINWLISPAVEQPKELHSAETLLREVQIPEDMEGVRALRDDQDFIYVLLNQHEIAVVNPNGGIRKFRTEQIIRDGELKIHKIQAIAPPSIYLQEREQTTVALVDVLREAKVLRTQKEIDYWTIMGTRKGTVIDKENKGKKYTISPLTSPHKAVLVSEKDPEKSISIPHSSILEDTRFTIIPPYVPFEYIPGQVFIENLETHEVYRLTGFFNEEVVFVVDERIKYAPPAESKKLKKIEVKKPELFRIYVEVREKREKTRQALQVILGEDVIIHVNDSFWDEDTLIPDSF